MATRIYLIRHGETEGFSIGGESRYKGQTDVPLSPGGEEQMRQVGIRLADVPFKALYSSDLSRARRSAELVGQPQGLSPVPVAAIKERNFGRWEGLTFRECRELYPEEFEAWRRNPLTSSPVGGESTIQVRDRSIPALEDLIHRHEGERIGVVAHGGINRVLLCHLLGMPLSHIFRIEQDFGAVNVVEIWEDGAIVVKLVNGIFHDGFAALMGDR